MAKAGKVIGWTIGIGAVLGAVVVVLSMKMCADGSKAMADADTVKVFVPVAVDSLVVRRDTVYYGVPKEDTVYIAQTVHVRDTLVKVDTVTKTVTFPIERKTYRDSTYMAVVSGYRPNLDYIETYNRTVWKTEKRKRWGLSVGAGIGYTGKVEPFVGVTLGWQVLDF